MGLSDPNVQFSNEIDLCLKRTNLGELPDQVLLGLLGFASDRPGERQLGLIPGYCPLNPTDIRKWAVHHMYHYRQDNDLQEVWAYLWENWYRVDRWPLWAGAPSTRFHG